MSEVVQCRRGAGGFVGSGNFVGVAVEQGSSVYTIVYINLPTIEEGRGLYNCLSFQEL